MLDKDEAQHLTSLYKFCVDGNDPHWDFGPQAHRSKNAQTQLNAERSTYLRPKKREIHLPIDKNRRDPPITQSYNWINNQFGTVFVGLFFFIKTSP